MSSTKPTRLLSNPAEAVIHTFPPFAMKITPKSKHWSKRVELEIRNVMNYIDYLRNRKNALWFTLKPNRNKNYNYQRWDGDLRIPSRPDIRFKLRIMLTSQYPRVFPRAFAEESIQQYCGGNIYPRNKLYDEEDRAKSRKFVMICHDHMTEQSAWHPKFSIAHFFIREVWYWWATKSNRIIHEWDKIHKTKDIE